jgi:hopanoid biosynthesis associated RND transporter like protein HpnN
VLAIFTMLLAGVVWTCVYAALTVGSFNTLSLVFLVMFFGLGVDFAIHFCLRVQEALSSRSEKQQALRSAIEDVGTALLLCTITSAIAFLSFLPTEYSGLAELGIISAGGIAIAFILTVTLLPAWFTAVAMPAPWHRDTGSRSHFGIDQYKPSTVLLLTALVSCAAAWYAKDVHFDYSVLAMRDKTSEAMATLLELQNEQVSTDYSVSVLVEPNAVDALAQRLWALPSVAQVITPRSRIASEQLQKQALLAPLAAYGALRLQLPEHMDNAAVDTAQASLIDQVSVAAGFANAQALPLLSSVRAGLQALGSKAARETLQANVLTPLFDDVLVLKKQLLASPYSLDDLPPVSRARLIAPDGRHRLEVLPREQLNDLMLLNQFVAEVETIAPNIAGRAVVERGVGQLVVESFRMATTLALVGIFIVLVLYFRELLTPVLVLIPLGLTTLFTFAVIELSGLTLNMANILVVPLIFGLGVDTGIHVVHRYHVSRNISELLRSSTPRAVTLSALTTIGTFISLSFNPHKGAASIGLILSVAISLLMLVTFVVLPALLAQFEKKSLYRTTSEDEPSG